MSSTNIYHKHHIVPKHAGGTDDLSNIVLLTVEEHIEHHKYRYDMLGEWQDRVAWKGLSGIIGKEEIIKELQLQGSIKGAATIRGKPHSRRGKMPSRKGKTHRGTKHSLEWIEEMRTFMIGRKHCLGYIKTDEQRLSSRLAKLGDRWITNGTDNKCHKDTKNIPNGWWFGRTRHWLK